MSVSIRSGIRILSTRILSSKVIRIVFIFLTFYLIVNKFTTSLMYRRDRTQKELKYILNKGLNILSVPKYVKKLPNTDSENDLEIINETLQELRTDFEFHINKTLIENMQKANGVMYILENSFLSDPIEGFRPFISLQRLASRYNYLTVLPQVEDGYYFTLDCTFRSARVSKPLPIQSYFNIDKLQHILMSYNLGSFIPNEYAKNAIFLDLVVVFFIYDHHIVEIPRTPKIFNSKIINLQKEFNYIYRDTIFKQSNEQIYSKECSYHLEQMAICIKNELNSLNDGLYKISNVLCFDAKTPISADSFFDELRLNENGSTVVFINWKGYQHATQSQLEDKLTLTHPVHDHILIIPFSDMVNKATERYLRNLWFSKYSYLAAVIDLNALMESKLVLSTQEFNICLDKFQNNMRYLNFYRLILTNAYHPSSLELDNYTAHSLNELIRSKFSNGLIPMVDSHRSLIYPITDMGLSFLIDVNLIRFGGATVVFSLNTRSRSIYSYYYDNHVNDFSLTFHSFDC